MVGFECSHSAGWTPWLKECHRARHAPVCVASCKFDIAATALPESSFTNAVFGAGRRSSVSSKLQPLNRPGLIYFPCSLPSHQRGPHAYRTLLGRRRNALVTEVDKSKVECCQSSHQDWSIDWYMPLCQRMVISELNKNRMMKRIAGQKIAIKTF